MTQPAVLTPAQIFADMVADCLRRVRQWTPGLDGMLG